MQVIAAPKDYSLYPEFVASTVMAVRMKLGTSQILLSYRKSSGNQLPVLVIDFFNDKGKLYTLRYNLPPDIPERTHRRVSLLLHLLRKGLAETPPEAE